MRNAIKYYYNIDVDKLISCGNGYCFNQYYLKELIYNIDIELYNYLITNNIYIYKIVNNINNSYITKIDNKQYILLLIDKRVSISLDSINNFFIDIKINRDINLAKLWEIKVDYYEKEMSKIKNKDILKIFPYYIGLSENAISIYKESNNNGKVGLCHKRLDYDINFYSPDNITIDYYVRDISEYIKLLFFEDRLDINGIINYINYMYLSNDDYIVLFARLLFPSYFYDCIENNKDVVKYSSKINQYERMLNIFYNSFKLKSSIPKIDWLIKKDID